MKFPLTSQISLLADEVRALAAGHWAMFRLEMAGKARLTRQQAILAIAGVIAALTAMLLLLFSITLMLSQLLVSLAHWDAPVAAGVSALFIAIAAGLTGFILIRNAGSALREEGVTPKETLRSLRVSAATLADQPLQPQIPPPTTMNTSKQFRSAVNHTAETIQDQTRRAGRAVRNTADTISSKFDPGAFFSNVMTWVDDILNPQNRALAGRALAAASVLPRRHPLPAAVIGFGAAWMLWRKMQQESAQEAVESFSATSAEACRDFIDQSSSAVRKGYRAASEGAQAAVRASHDVRGAFNDASSRWADSGRHAAATLKEATHDAATRAREVYDDARGYVTDTVESAADTAKKIRKDAEAGLKKAQEFAREEPALAIAGGIALAIGAVLLVKSSRR
ncbi:MAG: phage holin family protein [Verrucomicrobiota bacterium]